MDGDRVFDLVWGSMTGALCFAMAVPILWSSLFVRTRSALFGARLDPRGILQIGYGVLGMAMAFTNVLCRAIPHDELAYVHPAFALETLALALFLGPAVIRMVRTTRRRATVATAGRR